VLAILLQTALNYATIVTVLPINYDAMVTMLPIQARKAG